MSKYVKIYNEQGLPLGFKGYNNVSSAIGEANVKLYDENGGLVGYSGQGGSEDYSLKYLTTIARGDGTISFNIWATMGTDYITSISYSTDDGATWGTTNNTDDKEANLQIEVDVNEGDKILWKGVAKQTGYFDDDEGEFLGSFFSSTCNFDVEGNVMSLLYGDDFANEKTLSYEGQLSSLFCDYNEELTASVINVEKMILPATTLARGCYAEMFSGCTSLATAPELPATTLAGSCYSSMFNSCTSLTTAPTLPATTLAVNCYKGMFSDCTSLTTAPELPAITLARSCYQSMFSGCTSLSQAPVLPATTLAESCYYAMFYRCTSLASITCLATNIPASDCTQNWANEVAASGTFTKAASMSSWTTGGDGIPSGWTTVDYAEAN